MVVDGETTELEDWFVAQGHVKTPTLWQLVKNAWIEFKFGLEYYNFPWQWKVFFGSLLAWGLGIIVLMECLNSVMQNAKGRKPVQINFKYGNDEQYDVLWYFGVRQHSGDASPAAFKQALYRPKGKSEFTREKEWRQRHHIPERKPKAQSEYSHTIYSNTRSRTLKKNKERHKKFLKEREEERKRVQKWKKDSRNMETEEMRKRRKKLNDGFTLPKAKEDKKVRTEMLLSAEEKELISNLRKERTQV